MQPNYLNDIHAGFQSRATLNRVVFLAEDLMKLGALIILIAGPIGREELMTEAGGAGPGDADDTAGGTTVWRGDRGDGVVGGGEHGRWL